jgi:hypothetical protein
MDASSLVGHPRPTMARNPPGRRELYAAMIEIGAES